MNVLSTEMLMLRKFKCEYCDGFGHIGTDNITVRLGKRVRNFPANAKRNFCGKSEFITYDGRCPTKDNLEE